MAFAATVAPEISRCARFPGKLLIGLIGTGDLFFPRDSSMKNLDLQRDSSDLETLVAFAFVSIDDRAARADARTEWRICITSLARSILDS